MKADRGLRPHEVIEVARDLDRRAVAMRIDAATSRATLRASLREPLPDEVNIGDVLRDLEERRDAVALFEVHERVVKKAEEDGRLATTIAKYAHLARPFEVAGIEARSDVKRGTTGFWW